MPLDPRSILKTYFETGDIPTEQQFSNMIDSMVNMPSDGISRVEKVSDFPLLGISTTNPTGRLGIRSTDSDQKIMSFHNSNNELRWEFKLGPLANPGLYIDKVASGTNTTAVFIDQSNSFIGIGTIAPTVELDVNGNSLIHGDLSVLGALNLTDLNISGNGSIAGTLYVGNNATFDQDVTVNGALNLTNLDISGDGNIDGTLTVGGDATFSSDLTVDGSLNLNDLTVGGNGTINGNLSVGGNQDITGTLTVTGTQTNNADLNLNGNATIVGNITQTGNTGITGDLTVNGKLTVNGDEDIIGDLKLTGNADVTGDITQAGNSNITGDLDLIGNATITGNVTQNGNTTQTGNDNITGNLSVTGDTELTGNLTQSSGDFTLAGNASITGNLTQTGDYDLTGNITQTGNQTITGIITTDGFTLPTGAGDGLVLTSDSAGIGTWQALPVDKVLAPFIIGVRQSRFVTGQTKTLRILCGNIDHETTVSIPSWPGTINATRIISDTEIEVDMTAGAEAGVYSIVLTNKTFSSDQGWLVDNGENAIRVRLPSTWIDLRTGGEPFPNCVTAPGVTVVHDASGMYTTGLGNWENWVQFNEYNWTRGSNVDMSFVFTRSANVQMMFGIGSDGFDPDSDDQRYQGEVYLYAYRNRADQLFGGGNQSEFSQRVRPAPRINFDTHYKMTFTDDGEQGSVVTLVEVDPDDWDLEIRGLWSNTISFESFNTNLFPMGTLPDSDQFRLVAFKTDV